MWIFQHKKRSSRRYDDAKAGYGVEARARESRCNECVSNQCDLEINQIFSIFRGARFFAFWVWNRTFRTPRTRVRCGQYNWIQLWNYFNYFWSQLKVNFLPLNHYKTLPVWLRRRRHKQDKKEKKDAERERWWWSAAVAFLTAKNK